MRDFPFLSISHFNFPKFNLRVTKTLRNKSSNNRLPSHNFCIHVEDGGYTPGGGTRLWLGRGCAVRTSGPKKNKPMFRVKNVPMFRDFAPKMDPCLGILLQKQAIF